MASSKKLLILCLAFFTQPVSAEEECKAISSLTSAQALKTYADAHPEKSLSELTCCLPENLRSNWAFVFDSKSAQGSSRSSPRVILFPGRFDRENRTKKEVFRGIDLCKKRSAGVVLTFNGDPSHSEYSAFELMELSNPASKNPIDLYRFAKAGAGAHSMSGPNPPDCRGCHGESHPRPIIDAIPRWPTMYGSRIDHLTDQHEIKSIRHFLKNAEKNPRYRCLIGLKELKDYPDKDLLGILHQMNADLAILLGNHNRVRMAELIRNTPRFSQYKWSIFGALLGCDIDRKAFLPAHIRRDHSDRSFLWEELRRAKPNYHLAIKAFLERLPHSKSARELELFVQKNQHLGEALPFLIDSELNQEDWGSKGFRYSASPEYAQLRYLIEGRGISMKEWNMDSTPGSYRFNNLCAGGGDDSKILFKELAELEHDQALRTRLLAIFSTVDPFLGKKGRASDNVCDELSTKSRKAFENIPAREEAGTRASGVQ